MSNLIGLHDRSSIALAAPDSWIVDTVALSENPQPTSYNAAFHWIARLNHGYGSTGTLPTPDRYEAFAARVAQYVAGSSGCRRWIIGNEPNLRREWPDNQPIHPWEYGACYNLCYQAIHALPGHAYDEVLLAGSGPWNNELKYEGNPNGDWIIYFEDCIAVCPHIDGFAIHAYTHGYNPSLVTSTARMDAPFQNRYYNFRTYQDYCRAISPLHWGEFVYLTESNGDGPWQATGLMPGMLAEINDWNESNVPMIQCVAFYRYSTEDEGARFAISTKPDVVSEYRQAAAMGYVSPAGTLPVPPLPPISPPIAPPTPAPAPERDIDPKLLLRGVNFDYAKVPASTGYWRITKAQWLENAAATVGPDHHILGRVLRDKVEEPGVPLWVDWPSGDTRVVSKFDDPNALFNYDYAMGPSLNEYRIRVDDGSPTDVASGIGMGKGGNPREHTSTWITFEWTISEGAIRPEPPILPPIQPPATVRELLWPVVGLVTQPFGVGGEQFGMPGHDGIDIAVPEGTPVLVIADGEVMYLDFDGPGYGNYVRIYHPAINSHSVCAHLSEIDVQIGQPVKQGDTLGEAGSTGNSTGPHVHYELRAGSREAYYEGITAGYPRGRYNPVAAYVVTGSPLLPNGAGG